MSRYIETYDFSLHGQKHLRRKFFLFRQLMTLLFLCFCRLHHGLKETNLTLQIVFMLVINSGQDRGISLQHRLAIVSQTIQGTGFNEAFQCAAVHILAVHTGAKVGKVLERAVFFPLLHQIIQQCTAGVLDRL